ncbi:DUF6468 domain-containing protein [Humitalea sp. 24SJ18S-53]|uniref:DUF6468 domain-containing protein n=1 Tax=Humitalea sp. 24SJ18S-53 TaxID=3422307 RepID=UPI003D67047D
MTGFEWAVQVMLLALLGAALPFLLRLERQLRMLRSERGTMIDGEAGLREATDAAESATMRLRATADSAGRGIAEHLAKAEPLRDDLRFLVERAEALADRLEGLVRAARPATHQAPPATGGDAAPSQAERDLLRALRLAK